MKPRLLSAARLSFPLAAAIAALLAAPAIHAATITWDSDGTNLGLIDGAGAWLGTDQWWNGLTNVNWNSGDSAVFGNGGTGGAVTLGSGTTVGSLTFNAFTDTYTLGTGTSAIVINSGITLNSGAGAVTILSPITLGAAQSWLNNSSSLLTVGTGAVDNAGFLLTIGGSGNTTVSSAFTGSGGLTKTGTSTLTLSGANGYAGTTTVNAGLLTVSGASGSINTSSGITVGNGATLNLDNALGSVDRIKDTAALTLNGGTLVLTGNGATSSTTESIDTLAIGAGGSTITLTGTGAGRLQTLSASAFSRTANGTALIRGTSLQTLSTNATRLSITGGTGLDLVGGGTENNGVSTAGTTKTLSIVPYLIGDTVVANNGSSFLTYDTSGSLRLLAAGEYTTLSAGYSTPGTPENVKAFSGSITAASPTVNSLLFSTATQTLSGTGTLTVNSGAIAATATTQVISGFSGLTLGNGTWNEGIITTTGSNTLAINVPISVTGNGALTKAGAGTLTLGSASNSFSGGIFINAGMLTVGANGNLGDIANQITFGGSSTLDLTADITANRQINLNSGVTATIRLGAGVDYSNNQKITGDGNLIFTQTGSGGRTAVLSNAANDFTGSIGVDIGGSGQALNLSIASLVDSAANIRFGQGSVATTFTYSGASTLNLPTRGVELFNNGTHAVTLTSSTAGMNIGGNMSASGTGAKTLTLSAPAGVTSTYSGNITNGSGSIAITKAGTGTWALGGTNTYSGATTTPTGLGGTVIFQGIQAVSSSTAITQNQVSTGGTQLRFLDSSAGSNNTAASTATLALNTINGSGIGNSGNTIFVGNNGTANGGTISNDATVNQTISLGKLTMINNTTSGGSDWAGWGSIQGANGYRLLINSVDLPTTSGMVLANVAAYFVPTTANVTLAGTIRQPTSSTPQMTLQLDGTSADNRVTGNIQDSGDAKALKLTKSSSSTWSLSGTNIYTGGTSITGGKLTFSGANSLPATGTVAVGAAGHLSLADGSARNSSVPALTLASLANLSFDWTGSSTGDQLTSTADITPTANSIFTVNLNRSGTPGGSLTLLTGGVGSTLTSSKFYLANTTDFTAALSTPTVDTLVVDSYASQTALTTIYWQGNKLAAAATAGIDNAWALSNGTTSNWSTTTTAYTATALTPGATANVIFANGQVGKTQQSTTLGADVTVNSVVIDDATAVTIAGASNAALTLMSSLSTAGTVGGTPGSAITVTSNAASPTINSKVYLGANQTWNVASTKTLTVSGAVDGAFSLTKADAGTVILSSANTYTGDTTISAGILSVGNNTAGTLGNGSYAGNIINNGTLQIWSTAAQTLSGVISGSGALNKSYGGTLTLSGANTYTGRSTFIPKTTAGFTVNVSSFNSVNGGTPLLASSSLGAPTNATDGTIDVGGTAQAGVTLNYTGPGETTDRKLNIAWNGNSSQTISASGTGPLKFTTAATLTPSAGTGNLVLSGTGIGEMVQGFSTMQSSGLSKQGTGTWILSGSSSYTTPTTITAGTLAVTNASQGLGTNLSGISIAAAGTLSLRNNSTVSFTNGTSPYNIANSADGATINVDRVSGSGSNTITVGNLTTSSTAGTWGLNFTGANGVSLSAGAMNTPVSTAAAVHTITNTIAGGGSLSLASVFNQATTVVSPDLVFTGTGNTTVTGAITQTLADMDLIKNGVGTLLLNGTNTYTGATTVNGGTLTLGVGNCLSDSSNVLIGNGILNLSATVNDTVGTLDPTTTGAKINLGSGATLAFADSSGVSWTGGALNITGTFVSGSSIRFGTSSAALLGGQLALISVNGAGAGTYTLNGSGFLVSAGGNTYADWIATFPGAAGAPGFSQDADNDGVLNGVENFFGTNPGTSSGGLVAGAVSGSTFTFTHPQNATPASDISAAYRWSKDLATFNASGATEGGTTVTITTQPNNPVTGTTTVTATVTGTATPKLFVRVNVTQN